MNIFLARINNTDMCICVELENVFEEAEKINVYNNGEVSSYCRGNSVFKNILSIWESMLENAYLMPAFGVSLNSETLKALRNEVWAEFEFSKVYESSGMPFEKLLINVNKDFYGFNLIRYTTERGYDGRCFYYDLNHGNMDVLFDFLSNL